MEILPADYPHLFKEQLWHWGPARAIFELLDAPPPENLIANVNLVPFIGEQWVILQWEDGSWEVPGGTLEPGEGYLECLERELREEAGARLVSFRMLGAWHCHSLAEKPYRPHLPHPEYYRVVGYGEVELVSPPLASLDGEKVSQVKLAPLETVISCFSVIQRIDLAELYQLAAALRKKITNHPI